MTKDKLEKEMQTDYPLINMCDITDEARLLAVAWVDGYEYQGMDIPGKQKLASDIMNYARRNPAPLPVTTEEEYKAAEEFSEDKGEWIRNVKEYHTGSDFAHGFLAGIEWYKQRIQSKI